MIKYQNINGQLVENDKAVISIHDLGLLRAYGIFDYLSVIDGATLFMEAHIDRFYNSAAGLNMNIGFSKSALATMIKELVMANGHKNAGIRLLLTGGYAENGYTPSGKCNLIIMQQTINENDPKIFTDGFHLMTYEHQRDLSIMKTTNYLLPIFLRNELAKNEADDVLYHFNDKVLETSRANVFIVDGSDHLITAKEGVLLGITRNKLLEVAKDLLKIEERNFSKKELFNAKEVFLASTTKPVVPITKIDHKLINNGVPGKITKMLHAHFDIFIQEHLKNNLIIS